MCSSQFCILIFLALNVVYATFLHPPGSMNLFLNREEMRRLLGLSADLFYIREGKVNDYALKFQVPIPANISVLHFTWQNLGSSPIPYSISLSVSDTRALGQPMINISRKGNVPPEEQIFRIILPCTNQRDAEVDVNIYFNLTLSSSQPSNVTSLTLKRKKICLRHTIPEDVPPSLVTSSPPSHVVDSSSTPKTKVPSSGSVTENEVPVESSSQPVLLVAACGFLVFFLTLHCAFCCFKMRNRSQCGIGRDFYSDSSMKYPPSDSYLKTIGSTRKLSSSSRSPSRLSGGIDPICPEYAYPHNQFPSAKRWVSPSYLSLPRSSVHIYCEPELPATPMDFHSSLGPYI